MTIEQEESYFENLMAREKDEYGYCELTRDEMNEAFQRLLREYKGKTVSLSTLRNKIYGRKYMRECIGQIEGDNQFAKGYWRCTQQVIDIANELKKRGVKVARDVINNQPAYGDFKPIHPWKHVELDPDTKLFRLI